MKYGQGQFRKARELASYLLTFEEQELSQVPGKVSVRLNTARKVTDAMRDLHDSDPKNVDVQIAYADSLRIFANLERKTGKEEQGEKHFKEAITLIEAAKQNRPDDAFIMESHARCIHSLGSLYAQIGRLSDGKSAFESARAAGEGTFGSISG